VYFFNSGNHEDLMLGVGVIGVISGSRQRNISPMDHSPHENPQSSVRGKKRECGASGATLTDGNTGLL
jgi:hypothetical protein